MESLPLWSLILVLVILLIVTWYIVYRWRHQVITSIVPDSGYLLGIVLVGLAFMFTASSTIHQFSDPPQVHKFLMVLIWIAAAASGFWTKSRSTSSHPQ